MSITSKTFLLSQEKSSKDLAQDEENKNQTFRALEGWTFRSEIVVTENAPIANNVQRSTNEHDDEDEHDWGVIRTVLDT